ncbi:hypothetical protein BURMUCGD2M_4925 [Burkholderia multivorans CGD2M]|uniref:Uncharacterized protein n=1 Tax=Burkholderia multivorans CGD2 TaxID=513052 RepID=B9BIM5_9BURK|nr:hypothetical protein BURMUCGD2_4932 [Burkholderia multivorans CGD2]EEE15481.1 hypothetical protein BURMUCGD2M_4925 [Burkholderia multivorans CGD2M]
MSAHRTSVERKNGGSRSNLTARTAILSIDAAHARGATRAYAAFSATR